MKCCQELNPDKVLEGSKELNPKKLYSEKPWKRFNDGWFTYFYNVETGEKKYILDPDDVEEE